MLPLRRSPRGGGVFDTVEEARNEQRPGFRQRPARMARPAALPGRLRPAAAGAAGVRLVPAARPAAGAAGVRLVPAARPADRELRPGAAHLAAGRGPALPGQPSGPPRGVVRDAAAAGDAELLRRPV